MSATLPPSPTAKLLCSVGWDDPPHAPRLDSDGTCSREARLYKIALLRKIWLRAERVWSPDQLDFGLKIVEGTAAEFTCFLTTSHLINWILGLLTTSAKRTKTIRLSEHHFTTG